MKKALVSMLLLSGIVFSAEAQKRNSDVYENPEIEKSTTRDELRIPDMPGYKTLKCDFHIHTVFSDGHVWPDFRVREAWSDGLDAIAITDHIEYRPNAGALSGDLNESYKIAKKTGDNLEMIVIQGTEITRNKPLGHLNALFIHDANALNVEDPLKAIDEGLAQGAFIMWNHPGWPDDKSKLYDVHRKLIKEKKIHGVEVSNGSEYYPKVIDWARDYNLAFMGNSDEHWGISESFGDGRLARPITLVFAKEATEKSLKEALFDGRTALLFGGQLFGQQDILEPFVKACVQYKVLRVQKDRAYVQFTNQTDIPFDLNVGGVRIILPSGKTVQASVPTTGNVTVLNSFVGENKPLEIPIPQQ